MNHSVTAENLGKVNGLGQMLASFARFIGPAFGGILWSLSVQTSFVFINFICAAFIMSCTSIVTLYLPRSLDFKKEEVQ